VEGLGLEELLNSWRRCGAENLIEVSQDHVEPDLRLVFLREVLFVALEDGGMDRGWRRG
jgi:hypothetical protein